MPLCKFIDKHYSCLRCWQAGLVSHLCVWRVFVQWPHCWGLQVSPHTLHHNSSSSHHPQMNRLACGPRTRTEPRDDPMGWCKRQKAQLRKVCCFIIHITVKSWIATNLQGIEWMITFEWTNLDHHILLIVWFIKSWRFMHQVFEEIILQRTLIRSSENCISRAAIVLTVLKISHCF